MVQEAIILLGGTSMENFEILDRVTYILKEIGLEVSFIKGIEPAPSIETVMKCAESIIEFGPDII